MTSFRLSELPGPSRTAGPVSLGSMQGAGGIVPTGTIDITANGTYDVTQYASADVNVSGGPSFGSLVPVFHEFSAAPVVGNDCDMDYFEYASVMLGSNALVSIPDLSVQMTGIALVAAGTTVVTAWTNAEGYVPEASGYIVTVENIVYTAVEAWSGTITVETDTIDGMLCMRLIFTVPDVPDGSTLVVFIPEDI